MDTTNPSFNGEERVFVPGDTYALQGRAMALFEFAQPRGNGDIPHFQSSAQGVA
jgi:hypothetical protein